MKTHAFVINLRRCTERRKSVLKRLSIFPGIVPEIVEAVDAAARDATELQKKVASPETLFRSCGVHAMSDGEVACALSHLECMAKIDSGCDEAVLVLEDDTLFGPDFGRAVDSARLFLESRKVPSVVLFSARTWTFGNKLAEWTGPGNAFKCAAAVGAYAYLVNQEGARALLRTALPLTGPFDHWRGHFRNGMKLYSVVPHVASFVGAGDDSSLRAGRIETWNEELQIRSKKPAIRNWFETRFSGTEISKKFLRMFLNGRFNDKMW